MHLKTNPNNSISSSIEIIKDEVFKKMQLLRIDEVCELTTLGKSTINLWVAQQKFPKPIHLSPTIKVWRLNDISNWIQSNLQGNY